MEGLALDWLHCQPAEQYFLPSLTSLPGRASVGSFCLLLAYWHANASKAQAYRIEKITKTSKYIFTSLDDSLCSMNHRITDCDRQNS